MTSVLGVLQKAIYQTLSADMQLTAMIGEGRIFDRVPRGTKPPFIAFLGMSESPNETATEDGSTTRVALGIWSQKNGNQEAQLIAARTKDCLLAAGKVTLEGHHLVLINHLATEMAAKPDDDFVELEISFQFNTEPENS